MKTNRMHPSVAHQLRSRLADRLAALVLSALLLAAASATAGQPDIGAKPNLQVMTANLYIGAGVERVMALDPTDPAYFSNLVMAVTGVYYEIVASQPALRLEAVADAIAARQPHLVAVQEASLIRVQSPGDLVLGGTTPATNVVFDYLELLLDALAARGVHYTVAAVAQEWDVEMPMLNLQTGTLDDARQTDRDAILVRTDLPPGQFRVTRPRSGNFTNAIQIPALGLSVVRGWCAVDVFVRGERFRFICTHLEEETAPQIQMLQALELVDGPARGPLPVILAGDFNADPLGRNGSPVYTVLAAAGFVDAWAQTHPTDPAGGLTWGHDEFLADPTVPMVWRIDLVLYRGRGFAPTGAEAIDLSLDRTEPPLWASDHATVSASFRLRALRPLHPPHHWPKVCRCLLGLLEK